MSLCFVPATVDQRAVDGEKKGKDNSFAYLNIDGGKVGPSLLTVKIKSFLQPWKLSFYNFKFNDGCLNDMIETDCTSFGIYDDNSTRLASF